MSLFLLVLSSCSLSEPESTATPPVEMVPATPLTAAPATPPAATSTADTAERRADELLELVKDRFPVEARAAMPRPDADNVENDTR